MGWWSEDIMGGDTPLDIEGDFEYKFGTLVDEDEMIFEFPKRIPGTKILAYAAELSRHYGDDEHIVGQVIGFTLMSNGLPMSNAVKRYVIACTECEMVDSEISDWDDSDERSRVLKTFRDQVEAYPNAGARVEIPHQRGLFEEMFKALEAQR